MENDLVPTHDDLLAQMQEDAAALVRVAEVVYLNREAFVLLAGQRSSRMAEHPETAMFLVRVMHSLLTDFASDLSEAIAGVQSGERVPLVVRVDESATKH